jgi:hypothetical protein
MSIRMSTGEIVYPTTERERCPHCTRMLGGKYETGELLSVTATRVVEPPQVYERDYRCPKCGYTVTARYVLPRSEDDYLSDDELAARAERGRAAGERLRAIRETRAV